MNYSNVSCLAYETDQGIHEFPKANVLERKTRQQPPENGTVVEDDHDYYTTKGLTGQDSLQYWFDLSRLYQQGDTNVEYSSLVNRSRTVRFIQLPFEFPTMGTFYSILVLPRMGS